MYRHADPRNFGPSGFQEPQFDGVRHLNPDAGGQPLVRLVAEETVEEPIAEMDLASITEELSSPGVLAAPEPTKQADWSARGVPFGEGVEGAFAFFDLGRRWIVKAFADITTPDMQRAWERIDD